MKGTRTASKAVAVGSVADQQGWPSEDAESEAGNHEPVEAWASQKFTPIQNTVAPGDWSCGGAITQQA